MAGGQPLFARRACCLGAERDATYVKFTDWTPEVRRADYQSLGGL